MRALGLALALGLWALAGPSLAAADQPRFGPPAAWVKPTPLPKPKGGDDGAYHNLLSDTQVEFAPDGDELYHEYALRLQSTGALTEAGSLALAWDPDTEVLTVHKVRIIRGDTTIDVLGAQRFAVLRRETNLERAQIDGELTATLQIEGLQVGDILDVAFTRTRMDPAMKGRSNLIIDWPKSAVDRAVVRAVWSAPKAIQWRAAGGLEAPTVVRKGPITEVSLDRQNVQPTQTPRGAPRRFGWGPQLELSEFGSWADVGTLMKPLYDQASRLAPQSPLRAEVAKIRAASSDPKAQAAAALALVEGKVRYLYIGMKDGGLVPADANQTWDRRFGDCKGKTVLLLALLKELGIEAEPAFVSTVAGDGLDARLPTMGLFDHVMVRAMVAGQVYWLDGTRTDDQGLDSLRVPDWRWSLPARATGSQLVKLEPAPLKEPEAVSVVRLDASAGLDAPAGVHVELILRADGARAMHLAFATVSPAERDKAMRQAWEKYLPNLTISAMAEGLDEKSGEFKMTMDGKAALDWQATAAGYRFLTIRDAKLGWNADFKREPGPMSDAPFASRCGAFAELRETIILPRGGMGFSAPAPDVEETVAGCAFHRRSRIEKGVFTLQSSQRAVADEFPFASAEAASAKLAEMAKVNVYVKGPPSFAPTDADIAALTAKEPKTAQGFIQRGNGYNDRHEYDKAIADLDKAIALDPKNSFGFSNRGLSHLGKKEEALAKADFDAAAKLNSRDYVALHGKALLAWRNYRYPEALAAFSRAVDLKPDNVFALNGRANIASLMGDYDGAIADLDEVARIAPSYAEPHVRKSRLLWAKADLKGALAEAEAGSKIEPGNVPALLVHAELRLAQGQKAEAMGEFAAIIAAHPSAEAYLTRASYREKADRAGRQADIEAALKLAPKFVPALEMQAEWRGEGGAHGEAIAGLTKALAAAPGDPQLLMSRARAYARAGDAKSADKDLVEATGKASANPVALNSICWTRGTYGVGLQQALADCDRSLAILPNNPATLDSRGFVLLRLGRPEEAVSAYDEALKLRPNQPSSLYGRGLAKLRLKRRKEGEADLSAGKAISPKIADDFAQWGLPAPATAG